MPKGSPDDRSALELARLLLEDEAAPSELERLSLNALLELTQDRLARAARLLKLKGLGKLRKRDLAERVQEALRARTARRPGAAPDGEGRPQAARRQARRAKPAAAGRRGRAKEEEAPPEEAETGARSKFDLGRREKEPAVEHIPWGYDQNRITAMAVDPRRMYAYWEVRDDAIAAARQALGRGGKDAWPNLRVYDVSGRIFDGTNAHGYFDVKVDRSDRHWFLDIGKPTSTHCVEIGMKSYEGYFQKIARSGRVDFPRAEPAGAGPVEWLSVHAVTGEVGPPVPGAPRAYPPPAAPPPSGPSEREPGRGARAEGEYWVVSELASKREWAVLGGWEIHDFLSTEWIGGRGRLEWIERRQRFEWVGPVVRTTWEAGPFPFPVEAPGVVEERHEGPVLIQKVGDRTRVIYGPWKVVIRGLGARAEGRVLATWEVRKSWITDAGFEVVGGTLRFLPLAATGRAPATAPGASERLIAGASERRFSAGSEVRLAGASEIFRVGASELLYRGASEVLYAGASERRYRGASERRFVGASERLVKGASEQRALGASERMGRGGSEERFPGASERRLGASEGRFPPAGRAKERKARRGEARRHAP
jgi:hypothetical protein